MATKAKAVSVAKKYNAEIEVNKTLGFTDVSIWSLDDKQWLASGATCLCDSASTGASEMWQDLIERMELGYEDV